ncbi:MAG: ATP-binding protein [Candidatus Accumulibacter propinquus]
MLLNALPAGVVVLDSAARVSEANPAARQMFGQAIIGEAWPALVQARLVATEAPDEWQLESRRLAIVESPLDSAGGRILLIHDVTAAHGLKAELERNQRLVAMGEMAASLAHQLRTPLATALLYSANLGAAGTRRCGARPLCRQDDGTAQTPRAPDPGSAAVCSRREHRPRYDAVPGNCLPTLRRPSTPVSGEGKSLSGSPAALATCRHRQPQGLAGALVNLLENALQACADGWQGDPRRRSLRSTAAHWCPRYRRRDRPRGPGARFRAVLYDRGQGTGLGLAIALGVARAHGGTINVHSVPGEGSEFVILLPVKAAAWRED